MSLVLKFGDDTKEGSISGIIYFDTVTNYSKTFSGSMTKHPVEAGATISHHYIANNPTYTLSGVISGVDISSVPEQIRVDGEPVMNVNAQSTTISVNDIGSGLMRFLPDTISQFLPKTTPSIIGGDSARTDYKEEVELLLETLMNGLFYNKDRKRYENRMTLMTIYEMDGSSETRRNNDLVMTSYSVQENAESGDALFLNLTFEKARFVELQEVDSPKVAKGTDVEKAASKTKDKGNSSGEVSLDGPPGAGRVYSTETSPTIGGVVQ